MLTRDWDRNKIEFVSKAERERRKLEFLGLKKTEVVKPINYIKAYPDHSVKMDSDAIIQTV